MTVSAGPELAGLLADLAAEGAELDALVAALPDADWARPTPAAGWTIAHQIAHLAWTDDVAVLAATDADAFAAALQGGAAAHRDLRRRLAAAEGARLARRSCSPAGATGRTALADALASRARRHEAALVRPADERGVDGHRPADGDLGARAGRRRRARRRRAGPPPGCGTSRTSACAPATSPTSPTTGRRRPSRSASSSPRPTGRSGPGGRGRRAAGHRPGAGLLPAGHPAPAPRRPGAGRRGRRRRRVARHRPGLRRPARRQGRPTRGTPSDGAERRSERAERRRRPEPAPSGSATPPGFYGDRFAAMREMLDGGELDVLTGDYLAELTMLILGRDRLKDANLGYAKTFLRQLETSLGTALDSGVRIVANAGGLNPAGLAAAVRELADRLGLDAQVAHVEGDDLRERADELGARVPAGRQRLPRRLGHRRVPERRRRRRGHRPGHRRLAGGRAGRRALRLGPHRLRRAGRRRRRRARDRVRHAGHRRQLLVLHRDRRPAPAPASRSPRCTPTARR